MESSESESPLLKHNTEASLPSLANTHAVSSASPLYCKVYKRRWYILFIFSVLVNIQNAVWNCFAPIQESCKIVFGWQNWDVLLLSVWGPISPLLVAAPFGWIVVKKGLRPVVILTCCALCCGKAMQLIPFTDPNVRTAIINLGQMIAMTSGFLAVCAPAILSAAWFPPHERTTATTVAMLSGYIGSAVSFGLGPQIVPDPESAQNYTQRGNHIKMNFTTAEEKLMEIRITNYMLGQLGILVFASICVFIYFPSKPPTPPSLSSSKRAQHGFKSELLSVSKDVWFLLLTLVFSVSYGSYFGWVSVLDVAVAPFGVPEKTAGWLGCVSTLAGVTSGILAARCADLTRRYTKFILILLYSGATISQLLFTLTCERYIPYSQPLLYVYIIASGFFFTGTTPLFFELIIEYAYPVSDEIATGTLFVWGSVSNAAFLIVFMFPHVDVGWMNWVTVAGCAVCVPVLLTFREKYTRLDLDLSDCNVQDN